MKINKETVFLLIAYIISLLPIHLPWFYFDKEIDGIKMGNDLLNNHLFLILIICTIVAILFSASYKICGYIAGILLMLHAAIYLYYFLFWYTPFSSDFNIYVSLDTAHYGFYLSMISSLLMLALYIMLGPMKKQIGSTISKIRYCK